MKSLVLETCLLIAIFTMTLRGQELGINSHVCGISGGPKLIINGSDAVRGQFPWMVKLIIDYPRDPSYKIHCGGSIITKRHVLTASHCIVIRGILTSSAVALYGHNNINYATPVPVVKMMPHPRYNHFTVANDIAILMVGKLFQFSDTVRPLCLPTNRMNLLHRDAVAAGWGRTKQIDETLPDHLQYTPLKIVHGDVCRVLPYYIPSKMLCARSPDSTVCKGDSGGPLIVQLRSGRYVQVGIASFMNRTETHCYNNANVFTRVEVYMPWIRKTLSKLRAYENFNPFDLPWDQDPSLIPYAFSSDDMA